MKISEAARTANVNVETIRFYERRGLIEQPRKPQFGGFRSYSDEVVDCIRFIRRSQAVGFSLEEIRELLRLSVNPGADCADSLEHAQAKLTEVEGKIASLEAMKTSLEALIERCPGKGSIGKCSIISALAGAQEGVDDGHH